MALASAVKLHSFPPGGTAVIVGAKGGIGGALADQLTADTNFSEVIGLSRTGPDALDITDEADVVRTAAQLRQSEIRLIIIATGLLQGQGIAPEKSWRDINADALAQSIAVNTIGPALLLKHFLPLLPRTGKSVCAVLSARVGSIEDNKLGGWYSYRAAKAALNQIMRTAAVELARSRPDAICVSLHPGTVATLLSAPFMKSGLDLQSPEIAACRLLTVINDLGPQQNGGFFDHLGEAIAF